MKQYKKPFMARQRDTKRQENKANKKFKQNIVRKEIYALVDKRVPISAVIERKFIHSSALSQKPILLTDCIVNNKEHIDHFWSSITPLDRKKLLLMPNKSRVYFTGVPHVYTSRHEHESAKVGVQDLKLIKE